MARRRAQPLQRLADGLVDQVLADASGPPAGPAAPVGERSGLARAVVAVGRFLAREPVVGFATAGLLLGAALDVDANGRWGLALAGVVTYLQKCSTKSRRAAAEDVEVARWGGAVEEAARRAPTVEG